AGLVARADAWRWSSLGRAGGPGAPAVALHPGPVPRPAGWAAYVNRPETEAELEAGRRAAGRGRPYRAGGWQRQAVAPRGLEPTFRRRGRPRKAGPGAGAPQN